MAEKKRAGEKDHTSFQELLHTFLYKYQQACVLVDYLSYNEESPRWLLLSIGHLESHPIVSAVTGGGEEGSSL